MSPAKAAFFDDSVATVRESNVETLSDVVVVDQRRIVLGRVRRSDFEAADGTDLVGEIMRLGPTTIRPDELVGEVTKRRAKRAVGRVALPARPAS